MKFRACVDGKHGACELIIDLPYYDCDTNKVFVEHERCECWCHITEIPDPPEGEVMYGSPSE